MNAGSRLRRLLLGLPWAWSLLFLVIPLAIILRISFAEVRIGVPPYTPLLARVDGVVTGLNATLANYRLLAADALYLKAYVASILIALASTFIALLIGYPIAYAMTRAPRAMRGVLLVLVVLPFWTSLLLRAYAWIGLLRPTGVINRLLQGLGLIEAPLHLINTTGAVCLGIVYAYLPFMTLPLYARLARMDERLREAAADLGAPPWRVFTSVTLPLSLPGVLAGALLVFIPAVGEFVIPDLLGGPDTLMIGKVLWSEFFTNRDWPMSAAVTTVMVVLLVAPIMWFQHLQNRSET